MPACWLDILSVWGWTLVKLLSLATLCSQLICAKYTAKVTGKAFRSSTLLYGRNVTCSDDGVNDLIFPSEAWVCNDLKIDNLRLGYWYMSNTGYDVHCDKDASQYRARHDIGAFCREMMKAHGSDKDLWSAMVTESSCKFNEDERFIFKRTSNPEKWELTSGGKGHVISLQCMTSS
jgi:hypothetical protein